MIPTERNKGNKMLVKSFNAEELKEEFRKYDRDYFSVEACQCMLDLFEESSEQPVELDIVGLCCEFSEDNLQDVLDQYGLETREQLEDNTLVYDTLKDTVLIIKY